MLRSRARLVLLAAVAFPSIAACSATPTPLPIDPPGPEPRDDASAPIDASVPNDASGPNDASTPQAQTPPGDPPLSFVATFAGAPAVITNVSVHPHPTVRDRIYIIAEMTPGSIPTAGPLQTGIRLDIGTKQAIGTTDCLVSLPFVSFFFYDNKLGVQRPAKPDSGSPVRATGVDQDHRRSRCGGDLELIGCSKPSRAVARPRMLPCLSSACARDGSSNLLVGSRRARLRG